MVESFIFIGIRNAEIGDHRFVAQEMLNARMLMVIAGNYRNRVISLCIALSFIAAVGCKRSETVAMSGAISLKGQAVETGTLVLTPLEASSGPSTGSAIEQGKYDIAAVRGPWRGKKYRVEISSIETPKTASIQANTNDDLLSGLKSAPGEQRVFAERIPAIYNKESTLEITIPNDVNRFQYDFQLR